MIFEDGQIQSAITWLSLLITPGYEFQPGDRSRQLCLHGLAIWLRRPDPGGRLEYRSWIAVAGRHRFSGRHKGRSDSSAGGGPQCKANPPAQRWARDCAEAADELCFWARVPGADSGLTDVSRLPRPGHSLSLAVVKSAYSPIQAAVELLASTLVPSGH